MMVTDGDDDDRETKARSGDGEYGRFSEEAESDQNERHDESGDNYGHSLRFGCLCALCYILQ